MGMGIAKEETARKKNLEAQNFAKTAKNRIMRAKKQN